ncbi:peptidylprolyl isomerase [Chiayiivirga flava]|uniref:peptidylprolyl isomerase n=1 Tax=Chiayiivirga flava TaxID=659595 RepID=A0A7W8D6G0_9GAMM|nr:peptidyl-prolyl cis-trans isomerase [Chiayiivirga flava]MBB5207153.1 hypothetical protein [Chiayiivirga flava]
MKPVVIAVAVLAAFGLGWLGGRSTAPAAAHAPAPGPWIARIGDEYVTEAMFVEEMQRRGGSQPGQFQTAEQRRALLDDLIYRRALVDAAHRTGLDRQPAVRRSLEQILANQYLQGTLRRTQQDLDVTPEDVRAEYERRADSYTVPARRRLAMIRLGVSKDADAAAWTQAESLMAQARTKALALPADVPHFGVLAREYSDDRASRYRGGVIGWIADDRAERYTWDAAVLDAGLALKNDGDVSEVLRGADGVYLVRLVEAEPARARDFDDLAAGIRQGLLQQKLTQAEHDFRVALVKDADVEVRESALAAIAPVGPAADTTPQQPPAMPAQEG